VRIRSINHKGLKRLIEENDPRGLRRDLVERIRNVVAALVSVDDMASVKGPPGWRIHQLNGIGPAHGASAFRAIGASPSRSAKERSSI